MTASHRFPARRNFLLAILAAGAVAPARGRQTVPEQAGCQGGGKSATPPAPKRPDMIIPTAYPEQVKAAEWSITASTNASSTRRRTSTSPKYSAYVTVKHGRGEWPYEAVLSSTGAIRLEECAGETLMVQIASKSMLLKHHDGAPHRRRLHQPEAA
jgi:hypothetical protein